MGVLMNSKEEEWKIFQMHVKAPVASSLSRRVTSPTLGTLRVTLI